MMKIKKSSLHFVGIGGIGVSGLANYYLKQGNHITGSDLVASETTQVFRKQGIEIFIGPHQAANIRPNIGLVVYSPAVSLKNPEIQQARKNKIPVLSYPQALGELTKTHFTIAVSGTHGKSTTTALIGLILIKAGLDPTVIVGTKLKEFNNSNCHVGKSNYLVIEADEHFGSFLNYWPRIIVLTVIEPEHLDYYKNFSRLLTAFKKYISHLPPDGLLVYNVDDQNITKIRNQKSEIRKLGYSLKQPGAQKLKRLLKIPGEHNVSNALSALTVAQTLNIPDRITFNALSEYRGAWRRFEIVQTKPFVLISDYGHHPTEVKVTLKATREKFPDRRIWCVFQPHQYQRTFYFFKDFVKILSTAPVDRLILAPVYDVPGREGGRLAKKVNSKKLAEKINKPWLTYRPNLEAIKNYLKRNMRENDVLIIMGAGDIYKLTAEIQKN